MSLQEQFDTAAINVTKLKTVHSENDLLELYALYSQGAFGDANASQKPSDHWGKAKFEAWRRKKGMSKTDAQSAYICKVYSLINSIGIRPSERLA